MTAPLFEIDGLRAVTTDGGVDILNGIDLTVAEGEVHALMGPNGSGKSTLASVLLGSPEYEVTGGSIKFRGEDITEWDPDIRGKAGIFLAFQYPQEIPGVSVFRASHGPGTFVNGAEPSQASQAVIRELPCFLE